MAEQARGQVSLKRYFGEGIEPGQIIHGWAVYKLDEQGTLLGISHVCMSELEARATVELAEDAEEVKIEPVVVILDSDLSPYVLGPPVTVMARPEVDEWVREQAKTRLGPELAELLGID